jgi:hypothetical protein
VKAVTTGQQQALERHVQTCVRIARLGFGADVMRLALIRNGVSPAAARLIALSVTSSHAALREIEAGSASDATAVPVQREDRERARASRAAEYFLGRVVAFFWFGLIAVAGGLALGWAVGFEQGAADGFDWVRRSLERLSWR